MHAHEREALAQEQTHSRHQEDTTMSTSRAELVAKSTIKFGATVSMTVVPLALAQGGGQQMSTGRAAAIQECKRVGLAIFATRLGQHGNLSISALWPTGMICKAHLQVVADRNDPVMQAVAA
jgi:hypothetical protein